MSFRILSREILHKPNLLFRLSLSSRQIHILRIASLTRPSKLQFTPAPCYSPTTVRTRNIAMASPRLIKLSVKDTPVFSFNPKAETAEKSSAVLQKDEEEHNMYFNDQGFHSTRPSHSFFTNLQKTSFPHSETIDNYSRSHRSSCIVHLRSRGVARRRRAGLCQEFELSTACPSGRRGYHQTPKQPR